jgi:hypothetical protein
MKAIPEFLSRVEKKESTIFRGHADKKWGLLSSIGRHYSGDWAKISEMETKVLDEFKKRAVPYLDSAPRRDIEWLTLMQHHGCPTRLLDFTSNSLIALFFASDPSVDADGEVIIADYKMSYTNVSDNDLFNRKNNFAYFPPHITARIIGQSGCFVYCRTPNIPLSERQIKRIAIPKRLKSEFRRELSELCITYSSLFPGVDGICQDLRDVLVTNLEIEDILS